MHLRTVASTAGTSRATCKSRMDALASAMGAHGTLDDVVGRRVHDRPAREVPADGRPSASVGGSRRGVRHLGEADCSQLRGASGLRRPVHLADLWPDQRGPGGRAALATARPSGEWALLGKDLCRTIQPHAHDEAVAVAYRTKASSMAAVRMDSVRVSTGRAEDPRGTVARGLERIDLRHVRTVCSWESAMHRLMAVLGLSRNA